MQRFPLKPGDIYYTSSQTGEAPKRVGQHQGAYFYTIGQKHGLGLNFKAYVYRIDIPNNRLYVTDKEAEALQTQELIAKSWHWITPNLPLSSALSGKIRYRQIPAVPCQLQSLAGGEMKVLFQQPQRAVAPGQMFVAYQGEICLGSGVIA